ncbi:hypothetical protein KUL25_14965 [Rhodobacteraceae bacterium N5(2021)]|uniref:Uncharacterized protein n=1 Tax=Gymnodinialimonas phycosphaerae TaxID=2841589 RepID=A0A975TSX3_9RHOB|nr:hypothetical protein [Gymnodinialimonas phycosphaerae]MBY4894058.1 hypothetical protein [Gymnodinialimonas phycosphaerae]
MSSPAQAQTIRVQSGDHPGFTRLVLAIGPDREWDLEQTLDDQWDLTLTPAVDGFDTSTAFNLIQRTRLSDLSATQLLSLQLACACDVRTFRYDTRFLVIDITDPDPNAPAPEVIDPAATERAAAAEALPNLATLLGSPEGLPNVAPPRGNDGPPDPVEATEPAAANPRLAEAAQIMAEQLARAAASGLLDIAPNEAMNIGDPSDDRRDIPAPPAVLEHAEAAETHVAPTPDPHAALVEPPNGPLPIRAETAFDTVLPLELPLAPPSAEVSCANVPFVVADWSDGNSLHQNLGALRRDLYDERDVLTTDGAIELAQHYLYYGFGAEALFWLDQLEDPPVALLHVAALLDGAETAPFIPVESTDDCTQGELLWRYMAGAVTVPLTTDDTSAIQRAFSNLPPGLRDHMGPRLAMRLVEDGYAGTARNIRDILHRGGRIDAVALRMLDLDMGISLDTAPAEIQQELAEALRDDGGDPISVLTHALAFDRSVGTLPTPARLTTADALIRESGGGQETDDLWREALLGHAALGQIDEAISRLGDTSRSADARAEALTDLIAERVGVGDTAALVVLAHTYGRDWRPEGSAAGRIQVSAIAALREEGLFEAAQILRDVRRALILPASDIPVEEVTDDATLAWQESDWARLAETDAGAHATIAARLTQLNTDDPVAPTPDGAPDLQSLSTTLEDSRAMRSEIAELLAQPSLP